MRRGVSRRPVSAWVVSGGLVVALVGAGLVVGTVQSRVSTFGWFAYAPLRPTTLTFGDGGPGAGELFGYFLAVGGLLVLGWGAGYRWSPRAFRPLLPGSSRTARITVLVLAGCASLSILAGGAMLLGSPASSRVITPPTPPEVGVAYSSTLELAFDATSEPLLLPGFGLLLGGLLVSSTALGHRAGQPRVQDGPAADGGAGHAGPDTGSGPAHPAPGHGTEPR